MKIDNFLDLFTTPRAVVKDWMRVVLLVPEILSVARLAAFISLSSSINGDKNFSFLQIQENLFLFF